MRQATLAKKVDPIILATCAGSQCGMRKVGFKISSRLLKEAGEHLGYPRSDAGDRSRKPEELRAAAEQHIVTASGKTIVGADDKAGGAVIMATAPGPRQFRRRLRGAGGGRRPPG